MDQEPDPHESASPLNPHVLLLELSAGLPECGQDLQKYEDFLDRQLETACRGKMQGAPEVLSISMMVATLINLYIQVGILIDSAKVKEQVAWDLQEDLKILPSVVAEVLPSVNRGNGHFDRNFFRVVHLMCRALEELRQSLDEYVLARIPIFHNQSLLRRLAGSKDRIRHALTLYNTYCDISSSDAGNNSTCIVVGSAKTDSLFKLREFLHRVENSCSRPCPKKILKQVAKMRSQNEADLTDFGLLWKNLAFIELDDFFRAGGLDALISLITSKSAILRKQALQHLNTLTENETIKVRICSTPKSLEQLGLVLLSTSEEEQHLGLEILRKLQQSPNEFDARRINMPGIIRRLMCFLRKEDLPEVQANAAGIMWDLSAIAENRIKIAQSSILAIDLLVKLFNSSSNTLQFCAGAILFNLCIEEHIKAMVRSSKNISINLVVLIRSEDPEQTPSSIIDHVIKEHIYAGSLGWAMGMLDSPSHLHHVCGMSMMAAFPRNKLGIAISEGLIPRLVRLLFSKSASVQAGACDLLARISVPNDSEVRIATQPGIMNRLVDLLGSGTATICENAIRVLENLSFNKQNRFEILQIENSLEKISAMLYASSIQAQVSAASTLWNLSNTNGTNKLKIGAIDGVINRLAELLNTKNAAVQEKCGGALMNLSYSTANRVKIGNIDGIFKRLVKLLGSRAAMVHQNAAGVMYNLSGTRSNASIIAGTGSAILGLVGLLRSPSHSAQEYAAGTLANVATMVDDSRDIIRQRGGVTFLRVLSQHSPSVAVRTQALRALDVLESVS